ncbi:DUF2187 domain-containing protein [Bacillus lacus]|uniref:DUF2187 domain-containing protein n=1 Tax=Metabacillus lacus TaxID=1983721 RepID=A0A7X2J0N7_9BACI|nr:DUF2187 family protein [Metabacillus lacus]MRX73094.1 DUF2187 domain-containing protein [Metabacillus lacus]
MRANIGDIIGFTRKDMHLEGVVTHIRENSVIVKLASCYDFRDLNIDNEFTVVGHSKYEVVQSAKIHLADEQTA